MLRSTGVMLFVSILLRSVPITAQPAEQNEDKEGNSKAAAQAVTGQPVSSTIESSDAPIESKQQDNMLQENSLTACKDGKDNDGDTYIDCDDQDCLIYALCVKAPPKTESSEKKRTAEGAPDAKAGQTIIHRPFSLGFVPGLTTDGGADGPTMNNFSLNFIGWGDYLKGVELGYLGNIRKKDAVGFQGAGIFNHLVGTGRGFQGAGIYNYTNGTFTGFQAAGIASITRGVFQGFQAAGITSLSLGDSTGLQASGINNLTGGDRSGLEAAGITNVTRGFLSGLQVAGIANIVLDGFRGVQASGIANVSSANSTGVQAAGISNTTAGAHRGIQAAGIASYASSLRGMQASGIANITSGTSEGLQAAGIINVTRRGSGAQIGLVNIATEEIKGAQVGIVNYAGNGILAPAFWGSDNSLLNVGLKMGGRYTYGLFGYGIHPIGDEKQRRDSLFAGFGGHIELDPLWVELDFVSHFLRADYTWNNYEFDFIQKFRTVLGYRVIEQLSLFAGPTLNLLVSRARDDVALIPELWNGTDSDGDINLSLTLGFMVGVQWEPKWGRLNTR